MRPALGSRSITERPPGLESLDDERFAAGIRPIPPCIVHRDVDMADARLHFERRGTKDRDDAEVFGTVLDTDQTAGE